MIINDRVFYHGSKVCSTFFLHYPGYVNCACLTPCCSVMILLVELSLKSKSATTNVSTAFFFCLLHKCPGWKSFIMKSIRANYESMCHNRTLCKVKNLDINKTNKMQKLLSSYDFLLTIATKHPLSSCKLNISYVRQGLKSGIAV